MFSSTQREYYDICKQCQRLLIWRFERNKIKKRLTKKLKKCVVQGLYDCILQSCQFASLQRKPALKDVSWKCPAEQLIYLVGWEHYELGAHIAWNSMELIKASSLNSTHIKWISSGGAEQLPPTKWEPVLGQRVPTLLSCCCWLQIPVLPFVSNLCKSITKDETCYIMVYQQDFDICQMCFCKMEKPNRKLSPFVAICWFSFSVYWIPMQNAFIIIVELELNK